MTGARLQIRTEEHARLSVSRPGGMVMRPYPAALPSHFIFRPFLD